MIDPFVKKAALLFRSQLEKLKLFTGTFVAPINWPCVSKQCPADGVWRIGRGGSPARVLKTRFTPSESSAGHGLPPQRAPKQCPVNGVRRVLWGPVSRHGLLDTLKIRRLFVTCGVFTRYFFVAFSWLCRGFLVALFCLEKQCSGLFRYFFVGTGLATRKIASL